MRLGDVTLLLVPLTHEHPRSALLESLVLLNGEDTVRLLDVVIVSRATRRSGALTEIDLSDFALAGIAVRAPGLIGLEDVAGLAAQLQVGASAAIVLVEHDPPVELLCLAALRRDLIAERHVPAVVANTVYETAQRTWVPRRPGARRHCHTVVRTASRRDETSSFR